MAINEKVWGVIPQAVADALNKNNDWKSRTKAIEEVEIAVTKELENPFDDFHLYITDICKKMIKMVSDSNFKISLTSLLIIQKVAAKYASELIPILGHVIQQLVQKLDDNKLVIRHAILRIINNLVKQLDCSERVVNTCLKFLQHQKWHVRDECAGILIMCCLETHSTCGLGKEENVQRLGVMLEDSKAKV